MAGAIPIQTHADDIAHVPSMNGGLLNGLARFNVVLPNRDEVEEYAANHLDLVSLLDGMCAKLREAFGHRTELSLEMHSDCEQEDQYLSLYVRQEKYEAGILDQIESAITPFMSKLEAASGCLLITTDFRSPQG